MLRKIATILIVILIFISHAEALADDEPYQSATEYDYPPFSVTENGVADGFSVDLLKAVAKEIGITVTFKIDEWSVLKQELADGKLDILPLVGYNEERDKVYDFTVPYIIMHGNIFVRDDSDIKTEADLYGKELIVMRGDNMHEFALNKNYTDKLILTDTYSEAFTLLASGKYDAVLSQNLVGQILIDELEITNVHPATTISEADQADIRVNLEGFEQKFCYAVKEGDKELLARLNEGLAIVSANGTFNDLYNKWFPIEFEANITLWEKIKSLSVVIIPLIFLLLISAVLIIGLQVRKRKAELEDSNRTLLMLEAHLIHKQKLESIGILASGVAHEINNPINGIINYSQLIVDSAEDTSADLNISRENIKDFAKQIIDESNRVSTIVSNLLNFSRAEKTSYSKAVISTIVDGVLSLVAVIIKRGTVNLVLDISPELPLIECRSQQIQQVLINLITNANDALNNRYPEYDENKKIIISARQHKFDNKEGVRITVEDHGFGIPKDALEHVFDPFYTTKGRSEGTGLGLSISYSIAIEHGGMLSFETKQGEYTRFHLDLPLKQDT